jgi:hypothetical protein
VIWPDKFKPDLPACYDGSSESVEFLRLYVAAIRSVGGDGHVMANWLPMAIKRAAHVWLMGLPPETISSWRVLCERFIYKFAPSEPRQKRCKKKGAPMVSPIKAMHLGRVLGL